MVAINRNATRSFFALRRSRLLCATALVSASLPLSSASGQAIIYEESGTYYDDIEIPAGSARGMGAGLGATAIYAGNLTYGGQGTLQVGLVPADLNGTIIFSPESITYSGTGTSVAGGIRLTTGAKFQFGNEVGREYFSRQATWMELAGGMLDLAGVDQDFYRLDGRSGTLTNSVADTTVTVGITNGEAFGVLRDGAGTLRLRKQGSGALRTDGLNDFSGGTEIAYGTILMRHASSLGTGAIEFTSSGPSSSAIEFQLADEQIAVANDLVISGSAGAFLNVETDRSATLSGAISGSGPLIKYGNGTITLTGQNSYTGDTAVQYGTLVLDSVHGAIADDSQLTVGSFGTLRVAQTEAIDRVDARGNIVIDENASLILGGLDGDSFIGGVISGDANAVQLRKEGTGTLELLRNNTYTGKTEIRGGRVVAGASQAFGTGTVEFVQPSQGRNVLELGNAVNLSNFMLFGSHVILENNDFSTLSGQFDGNPGLTMTKMGRGTISIAADHQYTQPRAIVREGALSFDGRYNNTVTAEFGGTVTGSGQIDGHVEIADGGRLLGHYDRTLTMQSLTLSDASDIHVLVDAPSGRAFFDVQGDLVLDGRLTIDDDVGTAFGEGIYRLFNYGGELTDNGLEVVGLPEDSGFDLDDVEIQTAIDKQVNIVVGDPGPGPGPGPQPNIQFWDGSNTTADGSIAGGHGVWRLGSTNWTRTNGDVNDGWGGRFAVFQGDAGVVTVSGADGDISVTGMQFAVDGYRVGGDAINLADRQTTIRVGDGSRAGADYTATIASELRGDGALVKDDLGTLVLTGHNSYRGDTIVRSGTLVGSASSIRNNIANNGHVIFDQDADAIFEGEISGRGTMAKTGGGTLTLATRSALDWAIDEGGLVSRTDLFGGNVAIGADGLLRFEQNGSGAYRGVVSGSGAFQVAVGDDNFLRLTEDSSAFQGETTVTSGGLVVDGKLGGSLSIGAGTLLGGTGTVGTTYVASGATISPGNSVGTLTVNGDFTQAADSTYRLEVNPEGQSDLIDVSGTATIEGGTVEVGNLSGSYGGSVRYTILSADGGLDGTYATLNYTSPFLTLGLDYDADNVYLDVSRNTVAFCDVARTRNQCATARSAERLGAGNAVYDAIAGAGDQESVVRAFDQLSGELHASIKTALLSDSSYVRDAVTNRIRAAFADKSGSALPVMPFDDGGVELAPATTGAFALWAQGFGAWGHWDSDGNAARFSRETGGLLVGGDVYVADWRVGLIAGYSNSNFSAPDRSSSADSDNYHVGLYGGTEWGNVGFRSGLAYSWHDIDTTRSISVGSFSEKLDGSYNSGTFQAFGELGYRFDVAAASTFEPYANLAHVSLRTGGFTETGGSAALVSNSQTADATFTTLGLRASHSFRIGAVDAFARGMVGWRHAFGDLTPTAVHAFAGGDVFDVAGVLIGRDAALIETGIDFALARDAKLGVSYTGQFASGAQDQTVKANFNVQF
ncbi:MAG TPA: autotransporter domain-containing protein [Rhizobiaceae bacterium]|nr:autotransporter domain-containing protein [Rhizobiaceae bacterium]